MPHVRVAEKIKADRESLLLAREKENAADVEISEEPKTEAELTEIERQ